MVSIKEKFIEQVNELDTIKETLIEQVGELDAIGYQIAVLSKKLNQQNKLLTLIGEAICVKVMSDCERNDQDWIEADAKDVRRRLRNVKEE